MNKLALRQISMTLVAIWLLFYTTLSFSQSAPSSHEISALPPLHAAAHEGDIERVRSLLLQSVDLSLRDSYGRTALHVASYASHDLLLKELALGGGDVNALENDSYDILTIASVANDVPLVKLILLLGGSASNVTSRYEGTALIAAAHLGHHEVVGLLAKNGAPLDHINNLGWTALIEAVVLGDGGANHIRTVETLVNAGASTTIADKRGVTSLEHAKARGYSEIVEILVAGHK